MRTSVRARKGMGAGLLMGVVMAILFTAAAVCVFALLIAWLNPSDGVIRVVNQLIKLAAIFIGVSRAVQKGGDNGMLRGAVVGIAYMALGVFAYAALTGQQPGVTAYVADLAMGVAGGGLTGMWRGSLA